MGSLGIANATRSLEPFRVGSALSDAFGVMFGNLPLFLGISLIANLPNLYVYYQLGLSRGSEDRLMYVFLELVSSRFFGAMAQAMLVYGAFQRLRGRPVRIFDSVAHGLARFVPVLLTSITVTAIVFGGLLLLIIPGIIVSAGLVVAMPACVVERIGPFQSVSRSFNLTSGYKGSIFGAFFAIGIVNAIVAFAVGSIVGTSGSAPIYAVALFVWVTILTCYLAAVSAIIYHGLRVMKEGVDLEQIASVFD